MSLTLKIAKALKEIYNRFPKMHTHEQSDIITLHCCNTNINIALYVIPQLDKQPTNLVKSVTESSLKCIADHDKDLVYIHALLLISV